MENRSSLVTSKQIKNLLSINHLVDQISHNYRNIYDLIEEKKEQRVWFGPSQRAITLHRINDATVILKRITQMLQATSSKQSQWSDFTQGLLDKNESYREDEKELQKELEAGEMKLISVLIYYQISHQLNSIHAALIGMLKELSDKFTTQKS